MDTLNTRTTQEIDNSTHGQLNTLKNQHISTKDTDNSPKDYSTNRQLNTLTQHMTGKHKTNQPMNNSTNRQINTWTTQHIEKKHMTNKGIGNLTQELLITRQLSTKTTQQIDNSRDGLHSTWKNQQIIRHGQLYTKTTL